MRACASDAADEIEAQTAELISRANEGLEALKRTRSILQLQVTHN